MYPRSVHKFNGIKRESNQQLCTKETFWIAKSFVKTGFLVV
jgi:hypothetical protein